MTVKFFSTKCTTSSGGDIKVNQVTKINIVAPHTTTIDIPYTARFDKLPIEVLKMHGEQKDIILTLADFDNADATDFKENDFVKFDGVMQLKKDYTDATEPLSEEVYKYDFSTILEAFRTIEGINVS